MPSLTEPMIASWNFNDFFEWALKAKEISKWIFAVLIILIGFPLINFISRRVRVMVYRRSSAQAGMVARKIVSYLGYILLIILVLQQFGVDLGTLLGAAGIGAVAIGFAAQTSLSNIISGIFLIGEKPFEIGDFIEADGIAGTVDTIGLLSLTLRTTDNRSVRIPNETLVKTKVTNISRHPIRRYNLHIGVAYHEDIDHVLTVLREVAEENVLCLDEPAPLLSFDGFGDSSLNFMLGAWGLSSEYLALKNSLGIELKRRFEKEGIEIPFPHLTIAQGKASEKLSS